MSDFVSHHSASKLALDNDMLRTVNEIKDRLINQERLFLPLSDTLALLQDLVETPIGRFLIKNKGLNGFWTAWVFRDQEPRHSLSPIEDWLLHRSFWSMARERYYVFQEMIQSHIKEGMHIASVPCGLMDDLITLQSEFKSSLHFTGIDIDQESIKLAQENAQRHSIAKQCEFFIRDAWQLGFEQAFGLITSNGLNMYVADSDKLTDLYRNFHKALHQDGILITSFIPSLSETQILSLPQDDLKKEMSIFQDIIQVNYLNFCSESEIRSQLHTAGFEILEVRYNQWGMAPVLVAKKM